MWANSRNEEGNINCNIFLEIIDWEILSKKWNERATSNNYLHGYLSIISFESKWQLNDIQGGSRNCIKQFFIGRVI